uniref:protein SRC2 homolog n=1 Tax=Erigeron canadensis TaxID=72917 RepID=UPI001CB95FB8|nr:protein SRC2 homolog [Erigeron canadensis]
MKNHNSTLEITVVGCTRLKDTEWISRQDPYVCVEYGNYRNRTNVCTDGGKNPTFQEKFVYSFIEGLRDLNITVWNSNSVSRDDFIGSGKVQLAKVLSQGFDDSAWPLQSKSGRHAGEVRLIMHYSGTNIPAHSFAPSAPFYGTPSAPQAPVYSVPPPLIAYPPSTPVSTYPLTTATQAYPPNAGVYPPSPYPPQAAPYPPQPYPPNSAYPPQPYGSQCPHGNSSSLCECNVYRDGNIDPFISKWVDMS